MCKHAFSLININGHTGHHYYSCEVCDKVVVSDEAMGIDDLNNNCWER
jgi:hypothetical protein